jgi:phosphatidylethanolamine-binding protein (PEBP) family uncharacterized protein
MQPQTRPVTCAAVLCVVLLWACDRGPTGATAAADDADTTSSSRSFVLTSPAVAEGGALPADYTCDGSSATLPLAWSGAPAGTQGYAVVMHHVASPTDVHWYWVLYDIPATVTVLARNVTGVGTLGTNSVNDRTGYSPPCSQGPGDKTYTYTVYAVSAPVRLTVPSSQVTRAVLLAAISQTTLDSAALQVTYARP